MSSSTLALLANGKRSRSSSVSSATSMSNSSASGSIFSKDGSSRSAGTLSSCSSPTSTNDSPSSLASFAFDDERPLKALRRTSVSAGPVASVRGRDEVGALATPDEVCSIASNGTSCTSNDTFSQEHSNEASPYALTSVGGKALFVDCLVDTTVHVLDMVWHAPIRTSLAFLVNERHAVTVSQAEFDRPCRCPVRSPVTVAGGTIPLDLFVREALRRSRTSCSTLQAALLYCMRIGYEVVRKRAERDGVTLTDFEQAALDRGARTYSSLSSGSGSADLPSGMAVDPILCARRAFLASIMVSYKFLQDRTFSNRAWSKLTGLHMKELGYVERRVLSAIEFDLSISDEEWQAWTLYLKGEWKANAATCSCKPGLKLCDPISQTLLSPRKTLERTTSLVVCQVTDMELASQSVTHHISVSGSKASTPTGKSRVKSDAKTPTPSKRAKDASFSMREASSLLAIAVKNSSSQIVPYQESHGDFAHSNSSRSDQACPFPLRRGLAVRSVSTR